MGGLSAAAPVGWSIPALIAPERGVGTLGGILNTVNQIAAIVAPIVTGYIAARTHSFAWAFAAAAAILVLGIAAYIIPARPHRTHPRPSLASHRPSFLRVHKLFSATSVFNLLHSAVFQISNS